MQEKQKELRQSGMRKIKEIFDISKYKYEKQKKIIIGLFLIVPLVLLIVFTYIPTISMFYYSLTDWNGTSPEKTFVGLENYKRIFTDSRYFAVFKVSLYYLVGSFIQIGIALVLATVLSFKVRFKNFFKASIFFPYLINGVAIGFMFLYFYRPDGGLDSMMKLLGLDAYINQWLGDRDYNNYSLVFTSLWRYVGFNFVIFLGAIQSISPDIYEAAELDGANSWHKFRHIILPSIKLVLQINLILSISGAISVFEIPFIMTGGSNGTETFVIQTLAVAFESRKVGLGSALGIILLAIVLIVSLIQNKLFGGEDSDE